MTHSSGIHLANAFAAGSVQRGGTRSRRLAAWSGIAYSVDEALEADIERLAASEQGAVAQARDKGEGSASQGKGHAQACHREGAVEP